MLAQRFRFLVIYVTITDGHVTIFQIRLQTLIKLVGQAKCHFLKTVGPCMLLTTSD